MRIDVITLFPEMFAALEASIAGRAQQSGAFALRVHQLREHAINKHGQVDDAPYGGEAGMVLRPEPLAAALAKALGEIAAERARAGAPEASATPGGAKPHVVALSAQGALLTQRRALELAALDNLVLVCGHYKGMDQRFLDAHVDEQLSIGDYVLTGGELPAMVLIDAVARLLPGVLGDRESAETDSHYRPGRLGWPVYTRPAEFEGRAVPEVLTSGHHAHIVAWRTLESLRLTRETRPDLMAAHPPTEEERLLLDPPAKRRKRVKRSSESSREENEEISPQESPKND